ncbi:MAG: peroxiredoxin, partial [Anaerolineales bacterium]|nr:peroxiredoxin [Anaerolineales bacterium]
MLETGDKAPPFSLPNQNDETVSLSDFNGQWLILYFYPKDDTPGCTKEACDFSDALDDFAGLNAVVTGVSVDDTLSHRAFIGKYNLGINLLSDPEKNAHTAYGAWGLKKNYGKEYEGTIRSTFIISPEGEIAAVWRGVRVRSKTKNGESKHADKVR